MNWEQLFTIETLQSLAKPVGIGALIIIALFVLRRFLYKYIHKLTAKTNTQFDDIMVHETRIATILWCIWIGIWVGYKIANTPVEWEIFENQIIFSIFASFGIYTIITILMGIFKWYKIEICPKTSSNLDEMIMRFLITSTPILGGVLGVIAVLNILGISSPAINDWLVNHGAKLAALITINIILLMLIMLLVPKFVDRLVRNTEAEQTEDEIKKRCDTLIGVINTTLQVVVIFMFILMILTEIGINVTAVLAGAGVLGIAVGFGAQSLVKDVISGLFIIMENQYRKGDIVDIAGKTGVVEEINLRRTILRDGDGIYHVVPNGQISVSSNMTKRLSKINLNVSVAYNTNIDKAIAVINNIGKEMFEDPIWKTSFISLPKVLRIDKLGDSGIEIKIVGEVKPGCQWDITGELRLRIKNGFDKVGIEMPYPHTTVIFGNMPPRNMIDQNNIPEEQSSKIQK